jgi:hypothetical protein
LVHDIATEKNYEEVYQLYNYYEAIYDENERVVIFRVYKQGGIIRTEAYRYDATGKLLERVLRRPGKPAEKTTMGPTGKGQDPNISLPMPRR